MKIVILGAKGSGKNSLRNSLLGNSYDDKTTKNVKKIKLQKADIFCLSSDEMELDCILNAYLSNADVIFYCIDIARYLDKNFKLAENQKQINSYIPKTNNEKCLAITVISKIDLSHSNSIFKMVQEGYNLFCYVSAREKIYLDKNGNKQQLDCFMDNVLLNDEPQPNLNVTPIKSSYNFYLKCALALLSVGCVALACILLSPASTVLFPTLSKAMSWRLGLGAATLGVGCIVSFFSSSYASQNEQEKHAVEIKV